MSNKQIINVLDSYTLDTNGFKSVFLFFVEVSFFMTLLMVVLYGTALLMIGIINLLRGRNKKSRVYIFEFYLKSFFSYKIKPTGKMDNRYIKKYFMRYISVLFVFGTCFLYSALNNTTTQDLDYKITKATERELKSFYESRYYKKYIYSLPKKQVYVYENNVTEISDINNIIYRNKIFTEGTYYTSLASVRTEPFGKMDIGIPKNSRGIITYVEIPIDITPTRKRGVKEIISFTSRSDIK